MQHSGRWIAGGAALVVVVIAAVAVLIAISRHGPAGSAAGSAVPSKSPTRPSSPAASSPPAAVAVRSGQVTISPGAATAPHEAAVVSFLNRYFRAINAHDYAGYQRLFSTAQRGELSPAAFSSGYGTTHDSDITLASVSAAATSQLAADVTFTSHQQPADSPTHSSCTAWSITLYLVRQDHHYALTAPPDGYAASYRSCG